MKNVRHSIYGTGTRTGKANGIFIEVKFDRDTGLIGPSGKADTIYVSANACK